MAKFFTSCSLLMTIMFAYSASVQLNDSDWYFWFPLYACASIVNLMNRAISSKKKIKILAQGTLCLGLFLFMKVVIEDFVYGIAGFFSLNLTERVVREKIGSGLVSISMILHLIASSNPKQKKKIRVSKFAGYGMAALVCFSYGLPFVFFVIQKGEIKL